MGSLSSVEANLPPGFRFHPRDEELICDYLMKWVSGTAAAHAFPMLIEVDMNKCEPWDIPESACVGGKEWYFYCLRDRKYSTGVRTNRATVSGYWKATAKDRPIARRGTLVGFRKTLVFYEGRAPKGRKTHWVMHEFRLHTPGLKTHPTVTEDWVLCRVFKKKPDTPCTQNIPSTVIHELPPQPLMAEPYYQQVPCFSNVAHIQSHSYYYAHQALPTRTPPSHLEGGILLPDCISGGWLSAVPPPCNDGNMIKSNFSHFPRIEASQYQDSRTCESPSMGDGSFHGYLSEALMHSTRY